jgi:hypothetical protein
MQPTYKNVLIENVILYFLKHSFCSDRSSNTQWDFLAIKQDKSLSEDSISTLFE